MHYSVKYNNKLLLTILFGLLRPSRFLYKTYIFQIVMFKNFEYYRIGYLDWFYNLYVKHSIINVYTYFQRNSENKEAEHLHLGTGARGGAGYPPVPELEMDVPRQKKGDLAVHSILYG